MVCAGAIANVDAGDDMASAVITVTFAVPALATRPAAMGAVICVALTNVVVTFCPFHCTVMLPAKPAPFTVSVKAGAVAVIELGLRLEIDGSALIVNVRALELTPSVVITVTSAVPAVATSGAPIAAVNVVALTNVVVRFCPTHCTITPLTKFVPVTVSVNAAVPAVCELGVRLVMVGPVVMVNTLMFDTTPSGLTVVTFTVPGV